MLSIRYPWTLWGLGKISKTFIMMFLRSLRDPRLPAAVRARPEISRPIAKKKQQNIFDDLCYHCGYGCDLVPAYRSALLSLVVLRTDPFPDPFYFIPNTAPPSSHIGGEKGVSN